MAGVAGTVLALAPGPAPAHPRAGAGIIGQGARPMSRSSGARPANLKIAPSRGKAPMAKAAPLVVPVPKPTPAYKHTFNVLRNRPEITDRYDDIIIKQARRRGIDPRLVKAIIAAESEFSNSALSPRGARGLMQILPETAEEFGVARANLNDPKANIQAGTAYLARLYQTAWKQYRLKGVAYRNAPPWVLQRIVASYNAGPRALTRDQWMSQTRNYVRKVLLFYGSDVSLFRRHPARRVGSGPSLPRPDHGTLH